MKYVFEICPTLHLTIFYHDFLYSLHFFAFPCNCFYFFFLLSGEYGLVWFEVCTKAKSSPFLPFPLKNKRVGAKKMWIYQGTHIHWDSFCLPNFLPSMRSSPGKWIWHGSSVLPHQKFFQFLACWFLIFWIYLVLESQFYSQKEIPEKYIWLCIIFIILIIYFSVAVVSKIYSFQIYHKWVWLNNT